MEPTPGAPELVSLIIPCYDEESGLPQLHSRLGETLPRLRASTGCEFEVLLFDNGSRDGTLAQMQRLFGGEPWALIHHSSTNRNVGGALRDGLALTRGEIIVTLDSDCTYDPLSIDALLAAVRAGCDVVTASPYHPRGQVVGVASWRLILSKGLSVLYRLATPLELWTYTSLFRAYRRTALRSITWRSDGFLSATEILIEATAAGLVVGEVPAVLATRRHGASKIRLLRVIRDHLGYLGRLLTDGGLRRRLRRNHRPWPQPGRNVDRRSDGRKQA